MIPKDPLAEKGPLWENEPTFSVVALLCQDVGSRTTVSAVNLAKDWDKAQAELRRMIDVVTETMVHSKPFSGTQESYTVERGRSYAHVKFKNGVTYHFSIQKARWAREKAAQCGVGHPRDPKHGCGKP